MYDDFTALKYQCLPIPLLCQQRINSRTCKYDAYVSGTDDDRAHIRSCYPEQWPSEVIPIDETSKCRFVRECFPAGVPRRAVEVSKFDFIVANE